jgi:hypothetical protein
MRHWLECVLDKFHLLRILSILDVIYSEAADTEYYILNVPEYVLLKANFEFFSKEDLPGYFLVISKKMDWRVVRSYIISWKKFLQP